MNILINDIPCKAEYGEYIMDVAGRNGIDIPALCHNDALRGLGSCRLCVVELLDGEKIQVVASCIYPITRELVVRTDSYRLLRMRKIIMKLLLARSPGNERLNGIAERYGLKPSKPIENINKAEDCILCGLCVKACEAVGANAIATVGRGTCKKVSTAFDEASTDCVGCGACVSVCPTGAITMEDKDGSRTIWKKNFQLVRCKGCGKHFAPKEYLELVKRKLGEDSCTEYCSSCRKAALGSKFKDIFSI